MNYMILCSMEQKSAKSQHEKTYNVKAAQKLDVQVYEGMGLDLEEVTS